MSDSAGERGYASAPQTVTLPRSSDGTPVKLTPPTNAVALIVSPNVATRITWTSATITTDALAATALQSASFPKEWAKVPAGVPFELGIVGFLAATRYIYLLADANTADQVSYWWQIGGEK